MDVQPRRGDGGSSRSSSAVAGDLEWTSGVDAAGLVGTLTHYDAWGQPLGGGVLPIGPGYTGEWSDATGLVNLRFRAYDPTLQRFIGRDTFPGIAAMPTTWNRFAYANANPLLYTDPSGHFGVLRMAASFGLQFIPVIGDAYSALSGLVGTDLIAGFDLTGGERVLAGGSILIGPGAHMFGRLGAVIANRSDDAARIGARALGRQDDFGRAGGRVGGFSDNLTGGSRTLDSFSTRTTGRPQRPPVSSSAVEHPPASMIDVTPGNDPGTLVIGKLDDVSSPTGWRVGDHTLNLPPLPKGPGRWEQNRGRLEAAIESGRPIRDVSPTRTGGFLERERDVLIRNGWRFDPETGLWSP